MTQSPPLAPARSRRFGLIRRLARDRHGLAAVEFALLLPMLLLMWSGVVEMSNLVMATSKLADATQDMGDLIGRCTTVSATDTTAAFNISSIVMQPYPSTAANTSGYIASITFNATTGAPAFGWCDHFNGNCPASTTLTAQATGLGDAGTSVIIASLTYNHSPYLTVIFPSSTTIPITKTVFIHPRLVSQVAHSTSTAAVCG